MDTGQNLINAVIALKSASSEIDDLFNEFGNALAGRFSDNGTGFRADKLEAAPDTFREGWIQDARRQAFIASEGGRIRKADRRGELTLVADLGHKGWIAERVGKPYLYVFWAPEDDSWSSTLDDEGSFNVDRSNYALIDDRFFVWHDEQEGGDAVVENFMADPMSWPWFFAVPMMAIDSRKKVHDQLAGPIFDLLNEKINQLPAGHPADRFEWDGLAPKLKLSDKL